MKYRVIRKFASDREHTPGEVVELSGKHIDKLIAQRFIAPVEEDEPVKAPKAAQKAVKAAPATPLEVDPAAPLAALRASVVAAEAGEAPKPKKKRGRPPKAKPVEG